MNINKNHQNARFSTIRFILMKNLPNKCLKPLKCKFYVARSIGCRYVDSKKNNIVACNNR